MPLLAACVAAPMASATPASVELAGNAFITSADKGAVIGEHGLTGWSNPATVASTYFRVVEAGPVQVALDASLADGGNSTVRVKINGTPFDVRLAGKARKTYAVGTVNVPAAGYVKVDLQGLTRAKATFGEVAALKVTAGATLNYANDPANYYWSRRGPSVHMGYTVPANTEYFYNEMTIPVGQDTIGSYFMANGFGQGYMGIQVKSPDERRILFSVWDADNGAKTTLVSKGEGVIDNAFGGEGTGGQTYLSYNWAAGTTYRFITRAHPDGKGGSDYSAWFFAPETGKWRYIATWKRPAISTYLTRVHSFLENFIDTLGHTERRVQFGNQWARNVSGAWSEVTAGRYTGDATATNAQRMDYAGGLENGRFYLRNGGFFAEYVKTGQSFTRPATGLLPSVDVSALPMQ
ncbi:nematoblast specific protein [Janthinobacterium lividum]|uniref:Nematoblast specific protein n=2 Tax=Janthinobacterium lividum TaxID=29581 RepID=A0A1S1U6H4_9BURK|nr:nematoblast specific protein [Janthinobacterium lividum]